MLGMETLLANMLGVTPEQMRETISSAVNLLASLEKRLSNMEKMVADLHAREFPSNALIEGTTENA